jgi:hypothetical protein
MEWAGSMFQVVVVVSGGAAVAVFVMVASFFNIDIVSIDIDRYDVEYNEPDSHSYGEPHKASGGTSCLANHAESLAVDVPLSASDITRGGVRRV